MSNAIVREKEFKNLILARHKQFGSLLNDSQKVKKFSAVLLSASMDYNLSECSPQSIIEAGLAAAMLQLSPDKQIGQAYLVPYKTKSGSTICQLQIGYRGYIALLERIKWHIKSYPIYNCDESSFAVDGWNEKFTYKPNYDSRQSDSNWIYQNLQKIVTIAKAPDGELFYHTMTKKEIEKIRIKSPSQKDFNKPTNIWGEWYEDMAIKSAIKKHIKRLPIGDEVAQSLAIDDLATAGKVVNYEKTAQEGVIIEGEIPDTIPQIDNSKDANALLLQNHQSPKEKPHQQDTNNDDLEKQLFSMLSYHGVADDKIQKFISENKNSIEDLVLDEKLVEDLASQLNINDAQ